MAGRIGRDRRIDRLGKVDPYAVVVEMKADRLLETLTAVADALEAAVGGGVGPPAGHAADIQRPVAVVELPPMRARAERHRQRHDRPLLLPSHLVAQKQHRRPRTKRQMDELPTERPHRPLRHPHLPAAVVVDAARQIGQRQIGDTAVARPTMPKMERRLSRPRPPRGHRPNEARRNPVSLARSGRDRAIGADADAVGIP